MSSSTSTVAVAAELSKEELLRMYELMLKIRLFEERAAKEFAAGRIPGFVHLYIGEEAVAVGACLNLTDADFITSHHRGHGHCIAKGVDVKNMVAELLGRSTGLCKGKGGSMHIADIDKGMLGANGIVGGGIPLACGAAFALQYKGTDRVTVCFFGDGASNQGTFHEGLNLASIWKLPVVFVAENNLYGQTTPVKYHLSCKDVADRGVAYSIPSVIVDGMDVFAVYEAAKKAIDKARKGEGPTLIECRTYRYRGHFEGDNLKYRPDGELDRFKEKDSITRFRDTVRSQNLLTEDELKVVDEKVEKEIEDAWKYAESSPLPDAEEVLTDVYVSYKMS